MLLFVFDLFVSVSSKISIFDKFLFASLKELLLFSRFTFSLLIALCFLCFLFLKELLSSILAAVMHLFGGVVPSKRRSFFSNFDILSKMCV